MKILIQAFFILLLCSLIFQINCAAQAPSLSWMRTIPGIDKTSTTGVGCMVLDSNNAVVIAGMFNYKLNLDNNNNSFNLVPKGGGDIFIAKYTNNGNLVWAKSFGGVLDDLVFDIKRDRKGNLYVLGYFQDMVDFDPGPAVFNLIPNNLFRNTYLLKLDNDGNFQWVKTFTGSGTKLNIDNSGNIFVGGAFSGTVDFDPGPGVFNMTSSVSYADDMFVLKLDSLGNFSWAKQIRNLSSNVNAQTGLEIDKTGNVLFAGSFQNSMDFDPGANTAILISNGRDDGFVLKLNGKGDFLWVKQFGSVGFDKVRALKVDNSGNVYTTGEFGYTVDFDPGPNTFFLTSSNTNRSAFVSKLDSSGNFVYAKTFQPSISYGQDLALDTKNNLYISGGFQNSIDLDPGPGTAIYSKGTLYNVKLDPSGNFIWAAVYEPTTTGAFETVLSSILVDGSDNVYFGGDFVFTLDFDPGPNFYPVTTVGSWDMFLVKLGPASCTSSTTKTLNIVACNSYLINGVNYTKSGQYYQLLKNFKGCDSILQVNLNITSIQTNLTQSTCGSFNWNNKILSNSGIYHDTIHLSNGCDSIIELNLTVNNKPAPNLGKDTVICSGDSIVLKSGIFDSYKWNNGSDLPSLLVTKPDTYWVSVKNTNGCSATDSITITASGNCLGCYDSKLVENIYPIPSSRSLTLKVKPSICELTFYLYNSIGQLMIKQLKLQSGTNTIHLERFEAGAYFYKIYSGNNILLTGKIVKI